MDMTSVTRTRGAAFLSALLILVCGCGSRPHADPAADAAGEEGSAEEVVISDVTLGAGDEIELAVWRNHDLDGKYQVDALGKIFVPLAGVIDVGDKPVLDLRNTVVDALKEYLVDPQVRLTITAYRSRKVYVLGQVRRPGMYGMGDQTDTLIGALAKAGGLTDEANAGQVFVVRDRSEGAKPHVYNVKRLLSDGDASQNPYLAPGDIVYVPVNFITKVDRFFTHLQTWLEPIVTGERAIILEPLVENVLEDNMQNTVTVIVPR